MRAAIAVLAVMAAIAPGKAAVIVPAVFADGRPAISISGPIETGDTARFDAAMRATPRPVAVVLSSPGGGAGTAIEIGDRIRAARMAVLVPPGSDCASACALIWLAGSPRLMASTARVGFHVPQFDTKAEDTTSLTLSALIGAYETRLGYSDRVVVYTMSKPPQAIQWLTWSDADALGIQIEPMSEIMPQ